MEPVLQRSLLASLLIGSPVFGATNEPLGAIVNKSGTNVTGVTFRVWAPNATSVSVRGPFNAWNETPMTNASGYWSATVTNALPGQEYKYFLRWDGNPDGVWKNDPRGVLINNGNTVIYDHSAFDWGTNYSRPTIPVERQVMYEMHIGTFYDPNPNDDRPGTFDDAITRLGYLQRLGINVIALMPVGEFGSLTSWGYNPDHIFAVESSYGGPDGLKRFVRAAHALGIKVQLDVVHNHWNPPQPGDGLWDFDGAKNIYFYPDAPLGWTAWGRRPNYSELEVRRFIREHIESFIDDFRVDGFRWDSPQNFVGYDAFATATTNTNGVTYSVGNPQTVINEGKSLMMEINRMIHEQHPGRWSIAEDADLLSVNEIYSGFPGSDFYQALVVTDAADSFDGHWQTSFHNIITPEIASTNPNIGLIQGKVTEWSEPPGYRVIFTDNHDKSGGINYNTRLANRMVPADPTGKTARKKTLLNAALTLTAPGTPMLWMGQEFQATGAFSDEQPFNWRTAVGQHRVFRGHRDLMEMRELLPALQDSNLDASPGFVNDELDWMAYWRLGTNNNANVVVLFNFSDQDRTVQCPVPTTGDWHVQFNSDWGVYGADFAGFGPTNNMVTASFVDGGASVRAEIPVAAHSVVILARTPAPEARFIEDVNANGLPDGWEAMTGASDPATDGDLDGLSNLSEYAHGLDPWEKDVATVVLDGQTNTLRTLPGNPMAQHVFRATSPVTNQRAALFSFLANAVSGQPFTNPSGVYVHVAANLTNLADNTSYFFSPNTNLAVVDTNRSNWAAFHGVTNFADNPDGDAFNNLQEFARGSDPNASNYASVSLPGDLLPFSPDSGWNDVADSRVRMQWDTNSSSWQSLRFLPRPRNFEVRAISMTNWLGPSNFAVAATNRGHFVVRFDEVAGAYSFDPMPTDDLNADGIADHWQAYFPQTSAGADTDGDGLSALAEFVRGSDPLVADRSVGISVVGSHFGWSFTAAPMRWSAVKNKWERLVELYTSPSSWEFKFVAVTDPAAAWANKHWGGSNGLAATNGGNIFYQVASAPNYVLFEFDDLWLDYTARPITSSDVNFDALPDEWAVYHGVSGASNDPDNDLWSNLAEFRRGMNPTNSDALTTPKRMTVTGEGVLSLPSWNPAANNMTWSDARNQWEWIGTSSSAGNAIFKFVRGPDWTTNSTNSVSANWGGVGGAAVSGGSDITNGVLANERYRIAFNDVLLTYVVSPYPVSSEWWETNGLPAPLPATSSDARWNEDNDGDGFSLRLEYALGGSPVASDSTGLFATWRTNNGGTNRLVLGWLHRTNGGSSLSIEPVVSSNLASGNWTTNGVTVTTNVSQQNVPAGFQRREGSVPMDGASKFLRLRVIGP